MLTAVKPFKLELPYANSNHYVELNSGDRFARVSSVLSQGESQDNIRKYHAIAVGENGFPDYERAAFLSKFSCTIGTMWHAALYQQTTRHSIPYLEEEVQWAYPELPLIFWEEQIAGTADLLYKNSEGAVVLRDYKGHTRIKSISQEASDVGNWNIDRSIQPAKKTKWRKQLLTYSKAVKSSYGVSVDIVEIICRNWHTDTTEVALRVNPQKLENLWPSIQAKNVELQMEFV